MAVLDETEIEYFSDAELGEWQVLLNDWQSEQTHEGQIAYHKRAVELSKNLPVPPALTYRWDLLAQNAEAANQKLAKWRNDLMEQEHHTHKAYESRDSGSLARCASMLLKLVNSMNADAGAWTKEQHEVAEGALDSVKQATLQFFPAWLPRQVEMVPLKFDGFRHRMDMAARNLRNIGYQEQAEQVETQLQRVASNIKRLQQIATVMEEVKVFTAGLKITPATTVKAINDCMDRIRQLEATLRDGTEMKIPIPDLKTAMENLGALKVACNEQLQAHKQRAEAIWNTELLSIHNVKDTAQEIRALITIFDGKDSDLEDFRLILRILDAFEEHYQQMGAMNITDDDLDKRCARAVEETERILGEDDEIPWEIEGTYNSLLKELRDIRRNRAVDWIKTHLPKSESIKKLSASDALRIRELAISFPPYLDAKQKKQVMDISKACSQRLKELAVEGLLTQFKNLTEDEQMEFLKQLKEFIASARRTGQPIDL